MKPTIKDVAREAGVAISTVSKVINGSKRISQETTARVNEIMRRLNYQPNSIARNFALQSTRTVAIIMQIQKGTTLRDPYMFEILGGVEEIMSERGYLVTVINIWPNRTTEKTVETLFRQKRIDGIIIHASGQSQSTVKTLNALKIPYVTIGETEDQDVACWVDADNRQAGFLAAQHLHEAGYGNPVFLGGPVKDHISARRLAGIRDFYGSIGRAFPDASCARMDDVTSGDGRATVAGLLGSRPDGLICVSNFCAAGALEAVVDAGLRVPEDVGLITFDDYPLSRYLKPALSVIDIDLYSLGRYAAESLLARIRDPEISSSSQMLKTRLIARASTDRSGTRKAGA